MSSAYTVIWNSDRVKIAKKHGLAGKGIEFLFGGPHTSQPSFSRAGVVGGDIIYPIFVRDGMVHILSRVVTSEIVTVDHFIASRPDLYPPERHGKWPFETLDAGVELHPWLRALNWTCSDHVVLAERSTPVNLDNVLPAEMLTRLTYRSKKAERAVRGVVDGRLTTIVSLQGVYRLSLSSESDFASLFPVG
ncbi:hypothetical protein BGE01nite_55070 [Brevifollis gellanilyticus]|uniref:Uncharacterized protein n=1 Tax=Brevifollis gellanilyticus TaxID=748831 RepID=A0A512MHK8_9BACT|nr:hypothetical protein BGE01nite_55070 [Brevifollis gellanilyticus]